MEERWYDICAGYLACITIFGATSNSILLWRLLTDPTLLTPINSLVINIAVVDLMITLLGNPIALYNALQRGWSFGDAGCAYYGFLMTVLGITSIYTIVFLAYQRYQIICLSLNVQAHYTWSRAIQVIIAIWSTSIFVSTLPIFGWGSYDEEAAGISCTLAWAKKGLNMTSYILTLFVVAFGCPISTIVRSYTKILLAIRANNENLSRRNIRGLVQDNETHILMMVLAMVISFLISWGPYSVVSLIIAFTDIHLSEPITIIPCLMAKTGCCLNPVIYFFSSDQVKAFQVILIEYYPLKIRWNFRSSE